MATTKPPKKPSVLWVKLPPRRVSVKEANARAFKEAVRYA
jgi:hypothetical protein